MFAHLHTHTEYSELDGLSKITPLVERAKSYGQQALAITDHGNLYGATQFYRACRQQDIQPVLGMEAYVTSGDRRDHSGGRNSSANRYHLVLLAQNMAGWRNLIQLSTRGHLEGFYYAPRIDHELLSEHAEGLIALSGCPSSEFQRALEHDDIDEAKRVANWYREVFDDRYYFEIQRHEQLPQFEPALRRTVEIANDFGVPLVATQDSHYTDPTDHDAHDLLLCIGTNALRSDEQRFRFDGQDFFLTSETEMARTFSDLPEAVTNTQLVAERCDVTLDFDRLQLPKPDIPEGSTAMEHLTDLAFAGLQQRYGDAHDGHVDRLRYELDVINQTGFAEYFLIVMDFAHFARDRKIARAVRGSAAASLVLYCLDITEIDPMQYSLVFERFLNLERREMPDIDMDFADGRREEVIRYVAEKYGRERVAQIITFGTLGAKAAIRDSGRALGIQRSELDRVAGMVPNQLNISVKDAIAQSTDLQRARDDDPVVEELLSYAERLNGVVRNVSTHAAGVVISQEPLAENVPLRRPKDDSVEDEWIPMTQWDMNEVAAVGLLKMDFLGLTNLTILEEAVALCRDHVGVDIDYGNLPDGDERTYRMLSQGDTFGVFQLESGGMRQVVEELKPDSMGDLAALLALYRPGPMEHIPRFIASKHGRTAVSYPHADLAEILDDTYGVIVYQDQVLHIARKFAGYTLGAADVLRKAMGKKDANVMQLEQARFFDGARQRGYSETEARTIFELILPFAGYAFNKAHAVSYAAIAYQTAWFKANYPAPYMAAVLRAAHGNADRVREAAAECGRLGIPLLLPDVNRSQVSFSLERMADDRSAIRFGLATIKDVGRGAVEPIIAEREQNGPITSAGDLAERLDAKTINRRAMEAMAKAGVFDAIAERGAIVSAAENILKQARRAQELRDSGQSSMFDLFGDEVASPVPEVELEEGHEATSQEQLNWERELLGAYVSEHPLQRATRALEGRLNAQLSELKEELAGQTRTVVGLVNNIRSLTTRKGDPFAAVTVEDLSGTSELTVWPETWSETRAIWEPNAIIVATVSIRVRNDRLTIAVQEVEEWKPVNAAPPLSAAHTAAANQPTPAGGSPDSPDSSSLRPAQPTTPSAPTIKQAPPPPWMDKPREPLVIAPPPVTADKMPEQATADAADNSADHTTAHTTDHTTDDTAERVALWITIDESGQQEQDLNLIGKLEGGLTSAKLIHPGDVPVVLRIRYAGREQVLECSAEWRVSTDPQVVALLRGTLQSSGTVELRPRADASDPALRAADSAAG